MRNAAERREFSRLLKLEWQKTHDDRCEFGIPLVLDEYNHKVMKLALHASQYENPGDTQKGKVSNF